MLPSSEYFLDRFIRAVKLYGPPSFPKDGCGFVEFCNRRGSLAILTTCCTGLEDVGLCAWGSVPWSHFWSGVWVSSHAGCGFVSNFLFLCWRQGLKKIITNTDFFFWTGKPEQWQEKAEKQSFSFWGTARVDKWLHNTCTFFWKYIHGPQSDYFVICFSHLLMYWECFPGWVYTSLFSRSGIPVYINLYSSCYLGYSGFTLSLL